MRIDRTPKGPKLSWYLAVLKNYTGFSGRARRKEYWMFVLFHALAILILYAITLAGGITLAHATDGSAISLLFGIPLAVYLLATIVPTLAVVVRRLHDTGRSGAWYFIGFIPAGVGPIIMLVFTTSEGQPHDNQYGPISKPLPPGYFQYPQYPGPAPQGQPGTY